MKKGTVTIDHAKCSHQGNGCPDFNDCIMYKNIQEQRRWEAAKDAMKGILSNEGLTTRIEGGSECMFEGVAKEAVLSVGTLIKESQKS